MDRIFPIIRDGGKEWVTSRGDKDDERGRSPRIMQTTFPVAAPAGSVVPIPPHPADHAAPEDVFAGLIDAPLPDPAQDAVAPAALEGAALALVGLMAGLQSAGWQGTPNAGPTAVGAATVAAPVGGASTAGVAGADGPQPDVAPLVSEPASGPGNQPDAVAMSDAPDGAAAAAPPMPGTERSSARFGALASGAGITADAALGGAGAAAGADALPVKPEHAGQRLRLGATEAGLTPTSVPLLAAGTGKFAKDSACEPVVTGKNDGADGGSGTPGRIASGVASLPSAWPPAPPSYATAGRGEDDADRDGADPGRGMARLGAKVAVQPAAQHLPAPPVASVSDPAVAETGEPVAPNDALGGKPRGASGETSLPVPAPVSALISAPITVAALPETDHITLRLWQGAVLAARAERKVPEGRVTPETSARPAQAPGGIAPALRPLPVPAIPNLTDALPVEDEPGDSAALASFFPSHPAFVAPGAGASAPPAAVTQLAAQLASGTALGTDGTVEFALAPEELGHVRVSLHPDPQSADRMVVMLSFDRLETLDLFRRHAGDLANALQAAGYSGADISFAQSGSGQGEREERPEAAPSGEPPAFAAVAPPHSAGRSVAAGSLDLRL